MGLFDDVDGSGDAEVASPDPFVALVTEMLDQVGVLLAVPDDAVPFVEIELPLGTEAWAPEPETPTGADHLGDWGLEDAFSVEPADGATDPGDDDLGDAAAGPDAPDLRRDEEPDDDPDGRLDADTDGGLDDLGHGDGFGFADPRRIGVVDDDLLDADLALEDEVPIEEEPYDYGDA